MLDPGPTKWLRLYQWETGSFPNVRVNTLFAPCYHCENPVCVTVAPDALVKEPKYGAVLLDPTKATNADLKAAWEACPYGAIAFDSDNPNSSASKCTMCIDRLEQGLLPACVVSCVQRAIDFGTLSDMQAKYGTNQQLDGMPDPSVVKPAIVFEPHGPKTTIVPYDANEAITLLGARPAGLPPVFTDPSSVTTIPPGTVGRGKLNLHAADSNELMLQTMDDST
jgi:anaerobic dimethyl sulfoxide reductase subunit B (iron-sulfur subunit)